MISRISHQAFVQQSKKPSFGTSNTFGIEGGWSPPPDQDLANRYNSVVNRIQQRGGLATDYELLDLSGITRMQGDGRLPQDEQVGNLVLALNKARQIPDDQLRQYAGNDIVNNHVVDLHKSDIMSDAQLGQYLGVQLN